METKQTNVFNLDKYLMMEFRELPQIRMGLILLLNSRKLVTVKLYESFGQKILVQVVFHTFPKSYDDHRHLELLYFINVLKFFLKVS